MKQFVRPAKDKEFPEIQRGYGWPGWFVVLEVDGVVKGHVGCTHIHGLPFIHDLKYWGDDAFGAARLCLAAKNKIKLDWNEDEMFVNIDPAYPDMFQPLVRQGFEVVQIIMKKKLRESEE